jgi:threonine dehydratase
MITLQNIKKARENIYTLAKRTPLVYSQFLSKFCGGEVYLKLENLQITNSFKIRGALNRITQLTLEERRRGIVTASTGNHAQGVARVAEQLNIPAKIFVPTNTSKAKLDKIKKYNVEIILHAARCDEAELKARKVAIKEGLTYISPYNDEGIIAGQGTIGLEILEELQHVNTIIVPVGGGGLISGIAIAVKSLNPSIQIIGVQSEVAPTVYESLKANKIAVIEEQDSLAEGLLGGLEKDAITFKLIQKYVDDLVLVQEETIKEAIRQLWEKENQIAEGAGAIAIAPILENKDGLKKKTVVSVISGGNVEKKLFQNIINGQ